MATNPIDITTNIRITGDAGCHNLTNLLPGHVGVASFDAGAKFKIQLPGIMSIKQVILKGKTAPLAPFVRLSRDDVEYFPRTSESRYPYTINPNWNKCPMRHEEFFPSNEWRFENLQNPTACVLATNMNSDAELFDNPLVRPDYSTNLYNAVFTRPITPYPPSSTGMGTASPVFDTYGIYGKAARRRICYAGAGAGINDGFIIPDMTQFSLNGCGAISFDLATAGQIVTTPPTPDFWASGMLYSGKAGTVAFPLFGSLPLATGAYQRWYIDTQGKLQLVASYGSAPTYAETLVAYKKYQASPVAMDPLWSRYVASGNAPYGSPQTPAGGFWDTGIPSSPIALRDNFHHITISWVNTNNMANWGDLDPLHTGNARATTMITIVTPQFEWKQFFTSFTDFPATAWSCTGVSGINPMPLPSIGSPAPALSLSTPMSYLIDNVKLFNEPKFFTGSFETMSPDLTADFQFIEVEVPDSCDINDLQITVIDSLSGFLKREMSPIASTPVVNNQVDLNTEGLATEKGTPSPAYRMFAHHNHPLSGLKDMAVSIVDTPGQNAEELIQVAAAPWFGNDEMALDNILSTLNTANGNKIYSNLGPNGVLGGTTTYAVIVDPRYMSNFLVLDSKDYTGETPSRFPRQMFYNGSTTGHAAASYIDFLSPTLPTYATLATGAKTVTELCAMVHTMVGIAYGSIAALWPNELTILDIMDSVSTHRIRVTLRGNSTSGWIIKLYATGSSGSVTFTSAEQTAISSTQGAPYGIGFRFTGGVITVLLANAGSVTPTVLAGSVSMPSFTFDPATTRVRLGARIDTGLEMINSTWDGTNYLGGWMLLRGIRLYKFDAWSRTITNVPGSPNRMVADYQRAVMYNVPLDTYSNPTDPSIFNFISTAKIYNPAAPATEETMGVPLRFNSGKDLTFAAGDFDFESVEGWEIALVGSPNIRVDATGDVFSDMIRFTKGGVPTATTEKAFFTTKWPLKANQEWLMDTDFLIPTTIIGDGHVVGVAGMVPASTWYPAGKATIDIEVVAHTGLGVYRSAGDGFMYPVATYVNSTDSGLLQVMGTVALSANVKYRGRVMKRGFGSDAELRFMVFTEGWNVLFDTGWKSDCSDNLDTVGHYGAFGDFYGTAVKADVPDIYLDVIRVNSPAIAHWAIPARPIAASNNDLQHISAHPFWVRTNMKSNETSAGAMRATIRVSGAGIE